jgi:pimeloyl-ACP methyl ester carboxylesterase
MRAKLEPIDQTALTSLRGPVLRIAGTADPSLMALNAAKPMIRALTVVSIRGAGHMAAFSRPEFIEAIDDFIDVHPLKQSKPASNP